MTNLITLKSVSVNKQLSEETPCFSATVYYDGKKLGTVDNRGNGGPDRFQFSCSAKLKQEAIDWAKSQPNACQYEPLSSMVQEALDAHEEAKWWKAQLRSKVMFRLEGDAEGHYRTLPLNKHSLAQILEHLNKRPETVIETRYIGEDGQMVCAVEAAHSDNPVDEANDSSNPNQEEKKMPVQIQRTVARNLCKSLGGKSAGKWPDKKLKAELEGSAAETLLAEQDEWEAPEEAVGQAARDVLEAYEEEEEIEIVDDEELEDEEEAEELEDEDDEEEAEEPPKKPAKSTKAATKDKAPKKPAKSTKAATKDKPAGEPAVKKVGVIAYIVAMLEKATEKKPLSRKRMVSLLAKKFPERDEAGMAKTVNVQLPGRLRSGKGLNIEENDKGYFLGSED